MKTISLTSQNKNLFSNETFRNLFLKNLRKFVIALLLFLNGYFNPDANAQCFPTFSYTVSSQCGKLVVSFSGIPAQSEHYWDFGDGTAVVHNSGVGNHQAEHTYVNVNTYSQNIVAKYSLDGINWCDMTLSLPQGVFVGNGCGTTIKTSTLVTMGTFSPSSITNKNIYVNGNLEIDNNYSFTSCNLLTTPESVIKISDGAYADFNTSSTINLGACDIMNTLWKGIEIYSGGTFVANYLSISNALYAIRPKHDNGSKNPPVIDMSNVFIEKSFVGIRITDGPIILTRFSSVVIDGEENSSIKNYSTPCGTLEPLGGSYPFTNKSFAGIFVDGTTGAFFTMPSNQSGNIIKEMCAGIICNNASASINGFIFNNIYPFISNSIISSQFQGSAVLFQDAGNNSLTLTGLGANSTTINNCVQGIRALTYSKYSSVSISNCVIDNAQIGIKLKGELNSGSALGNFYNVNLSENTITCNSYSSSYYDTEVTGIAVDDPDLTYSYIDISDNKIFLDYTDTEFSNIVSSNPLAVIYMIRINESAHVYTTPVTFMSVNISSNEINFNQSVVGIGLQNTDKSYVKNNNINIAYESNNFSYAIGIRVEGGHFNTLKCNNIIGTAVLAPKIGIVIIGNERVNIDNNSMNNCAISMSIYFDNGTDCDITQNQFSVSPDFENGAFTGGLFYIDAITGPQYLRVNRWDQQGDHHTGSAYTRNQLGPSYCISRYTVTPVANVGSGTGNPVATSYTDQSCLPSWFIASEGAELAVACSQIGTKLRTRNEGDMYLVNGGLDEMSAGHKYSSEMQLYTKYILSPDLVENEVSLSTFISENEDSYIGTMFDLRQDWIGIFINENWLDAITQINTQIEENNQELIDIQSRQGIDESDIEDWITVLNERSDLFENRHDLVEIIAQEQSTLANTWLSNFGGIAITNAPAAAERKLFNIFLQTQTLAQRLMTQEELSDIYTIGTTCPGELGTAVYLARGWYYNLTGVMLSDSCTKFEQLLPEERGYNIVENGSMNISPNPNNGLVRISFSNISEGAYIRILDIYGRPIQTMPVDQHATEVFVNLENKPPGLYIVDLHSNNKLIAQSKILKSID